MYLKAITKASKGIQPSNNGLRYGAEASSAPWKNMKFRCVRNGDTNNKSEEKTSIPLSSFIWKTGIHSLSTSNFSQEELPSSSITTTMLISSLSHPCSRFWTQREKGLYFMSVESGEEVDKEVDSYNQHKHPYWPLLVFLHLMHHLSPYTYYFFPVHPLASKTVSWDTVLTPGIADNRNPTQPGI